MTTKNAPLLPPGELFFSGPVIYFYMQRNSIIFIKQRGNQRKFTIVRTEEMSCSLCRAISNGVG